MITAPQFKPDAYAEFISTLYFHAMNEETSKGMDYRKVSDAFLSMVGIGLKRSYCTNDKVLEG